MKTVTNLITSGCVTPCHPSIVHARSFKHSSSHFRIYVVVLNSTLYVRIYLHVETKMVHVGNCCFQIEKRHLKYVGAYYLGYYSHSKDCFIGFSSVFSVSTSRLLCQNLASSRSVPLISVNTSSFSSVPLVSLQRSLTMAFNTAYFVTMITMLCRVLRHRFRCTMKAALATKTLRTMARQHATEMKSRE